VIGHLRAARRFDAGIWRVFGEVERLRAIGEERGVALPEIQAACVELGEAIEIRGGTSMDTSIRLDVVLFRTTAPVETRDWYVKTFGAEPRSGPPGISGASATPLPSAVLPGVTLSFAKADTAPAGTRGRALDHIGFEVKNLEEFCKKLEAAGQKFDRPYGKLPNSQIAIAFLTDPWGTYIELTENLPPAK
jgi:catechol 2,3-dioxygenase-like lactoylglutathione lyase family enzyme